MPVVIEMRRSSGIDDVNKSMEHLFYGMATVPGSVLIEKGDYSNAGDAQRVSEQCSVRRPYLMNGAPLLCSFLFFSTPSLGGPSLFLVLFYSCPFF